MATLIRITALAACVLAILARPVLAQGGLPAEQRINGDDVLAAFEPQREVLQQSSAVFYMRIVYLGLKYDGDLLTEGKLVIVGFDGDDGTGAIEAGVQTGDQLISAGGVDLMDKPHLERVLYGKTVGEPIAVEVMRGSDKLSFEFELVERQWIPRLYGVIVSESGHILTKASEVEENKDFYVRVGRGKFTDFEMLGVDENWDVAMLKVNSDEQFTPVVLSNEEDVRQGHWVVSNGSSERYKRNARVGIISATNREIRPESSKVLLGLELGTGKQDELTIKALSEEGGALKAGLQEGDVLLSAGDIRLKVRADLFKALQGKEPGEQIAVEVMRGDEKLSFSVELTARKEEKRMVSRNDAMSGGGELADQLSQRRSGFPRVIHHDTPLPKRRMGGPLLNLDGVCVGMNIARADRVTTFAIPARELREIIGRMIK